MGYNLRCSLSHFFCFGVFRVIIYLPPCFLENFLSCICSAFKIFYFPVWFINDGSLPHFIKPGFPSCSLSTVPGCLYHPHRHYLDRDYLHSIVQFRLIGNFWSLSPLFNPEPVPEYFVSYGCSFTRVVVIRMNLINFVVVWVCLLAIPFPLFDFEFPSIHHHLCLVSVVHLKAQD